MGRPKASEADPLGRAKRGRPSKKQKEDNVFRTGFDGQTNAPWRKTVSIFKQPVTLVHTSSKETKKATEQQLKRGEGSSRRMDKPFPVMWAKSLERVHSMMPTYTADKLGSGRLEHLSETLKLAGKLEKVTDLVDEQAAAATLCSTLHNPNQIGAFGQKIEKPRSDLDIFCDVVPEQPLLTPISVVQDDISMQERRVLDARKRLQEVMKHFG